MTPNFKLSLSSAIVSFCCYAGAGRCHTTNWWFDLSSGLLAGWSGEGSVRSPVAWRQGVPTAGWVGSAVHQAIVPRVRFARWLLAGARRRVAGVVLAGCISALATSGCLPTSSSAPASSTASAPISIVSASASSPALPPWQYKPVPTLYAWGDNETGQLGDGSTADSSVPVRVLLPPGVIPRAVSEGEGTSLALGSDGRVYAWGDNKFGQLGVGWFWEHRGCKPDPCSTLPVAVSLPRGVTATAVSEGDGVSLAVGSDGRVYAWGDNSTRAARRRVDGQLPCPGAGLTPQRAGDRGVRGN